MSAFFSKDFKVVTEAKKKTMVKYYMKGIQHLS